MVKVLAGFVAAILIAAAAFFGFQFYLQRQIVNEVEAAFAAVRQSGATASHGRVSFDIWTRTITVEDIAGESAAQPPVSVKIGRFTASGVSQPAAGRLFAERIVAADVDIGGPRLTQPQQRFAYKAPLVQVINYAGPAGPLRRLDPSAPTDLHRFLLEHVAAVSATAIWLPSVTGTMMVASTPGEFGYTNLALREIRDGRIGVIAIDRMAFSATVEAAGKPDKMTGSLADIAVYDFDATAVHALFDPERAKDDKIYRAYRQMKSGAYTAAFDSGVKIRIDGMTADEIGIKPSKLQYAQIMAMIGALPPPGSTPTPAQTREMLDKVAMLYEGMAIGAAEIRGLSLDLPDGPFRLGTIRLVRLENGKLAEFALEGTEGRTPEGQFKLGRLALKSLDIANLVRLLAQFATTRGSPGPEQLAALLLLLEGTEIRNLAVTPPNGPAQPIDIDTLNLAWGQFVGPIPTRARATLKMSGPVERGAKGPLGVLADAGITTASVTADLGAGWSESTRAFALEPVTLEIGGLFTAAARASFANVAREMFSVNPLQAAIMAAQVEAGPLEIALRDTGGVELLIGNFARTQRVSRDDARVALVTQVRATAMQFAAANPDAMAIAGAVARFIEAPGGTLTIKLTPRGKVAMMGLIDAMRSDPFAALTRFQVDASNGR